MIKVLFLCHGNICRSPMAEFVMKDLVKKQHLEYEFSIASAATSMEEIGNDIHRGTKAILNKYGKSSEQILNSTVLKVAHHRIKNIFK